MLYHIAYLKKAKADLSRITNLKHREQVDRCIERLRLRPIGTPLYPPLQELQGVYACARRYLVCFRVVKVKQKVLITAIVDLT